MEPADREMTLREYLTVIRRRIWIVVAAVVITTGVAAGLSVAQTPVYEANAQMLVSIRSTDSLFDTGVDLRGADATRAVQTEIRVLAGERVRSRVRDDLGLNRLPPPVRGSVIGSTDVISVRVRSEDPDTARILADAYVDAYIDNRREQAVDGLLAASSQVQSKISELQVQVDTLADDDPLRNNLLAQQNTFRQTLNQLQVDTALKTGGASVVQSARAPIDPVEPTPLRTTTLAALAGLLLGLGAAFVLEYFDDSVRTEDDLERLADLSVLAVVPIDPPIDNLPVSISAPSDYAVEVYRSLRTNVQFLSLDRPLKVIQVTSSLPGEGKTTTASNLAVVLAQSGRSVAIVDADLRRPRLHEVFATAASPGLIDLIVGEPISLVAHSVEVDPATALTVIASGKAPSNPSEILSSARCREVIERLAEQFDHVIIDSAPILPVADSVALAARADAVLVVAQARRTSRREMTETLERLARVGAPVIGFILNQAKTGANQGTYGYGYEYRDGSASQESEDRLGEGAQRDLVSDIDPPTADLRTGGR